MYKNALVGEPWICKIVCKSKESSFTDTFKIVMKVNSDNVYLLVRHRLLRKDIPVALLLRALGIASDLDIL